MDLAWKPEQPTRVRYGVVGLALAVMAVAYLDRVCIAVAAPDIRRELGFADSELGYVFSAFTVAYALFEIPGGWPIASAPAGCWPASSFGGRR